MEKKPIDVRREEIINVCEELYKKENFKDITLKQIGEKTTFSRTSIYNYFQTKEEIFLELLKKEYILWIEELEEIILKNEKLSTEDFSKLIAKSIENREKMLKLLSMNMYDIEEKSRLEKLIEFKEIFAQSMETMKKCLDKFFKQMSEEEKTDFLYSFFPFMYGIYPYTKATEKQREAMRIVGFHYHYMSIYEITYKALKKLLK